MLRSQMLDQVSHYIINKKIERPTLVAIDGLDTAGKTRITKELVFPLRKSRRQIVTVSLDNFRNPTQVVYRRGKESPEGYYYDAFNYDAFVEAVLNPLQEGGNRKIRPTLINLSSTPEIEPEYINITEDAIVLCDGVFLMRPELFNYWNIIIFIDISLETAFRRAVERDIRTLGSYEQVKHIYEKRYFAGQRIYFDRCHPLQRADLIIDNNDFRNPVVIEQRAMV